MKPDAMLVIDVQNGLLEGHPYRQNEVIQEIQQLLTACRGHNVPVIYVQHAEEDGSLYMAHPVG